jgi:hypothetical protein
MLRYFVFCLVGVAAQLTESPRASVSPVSNRCCDPSVMVCSPDMPLCPSMAPTDQSCCDPSKTDCHSDLIVCPSQTPRCCDPTKTPCDSAVAICPSESVAWSPTPSITPSQTLARAQTATQSPTCTQTLARAQTATQTQTPVNECCNPTKTECLYTSVICPSSPYTPYPTIQSGECCDPTKSDCLSSAVICPSNPYTPRPSTPSECCDPTKGSCVTSSFLCASATPFPCCHIDCDTSTLPPCFPSACCDASRYDCRNATHICPSFSPYPTHSVNCCVSSDIACPADMPPCNTYSPIPTQRFECCVPDFPECDGKLPICRTLTPIPTQRIECLLNESLCINQTSGPICPPSMPNCQACCDPNMFNCPSDAPICMNVTQLPSRLPSLSQNPTQRPTLVPGVIRASENPTQRPSLLPEATKFVRLRVSARPTPWAVRATVQPSSLPVIQSKLSFRGANASAFSRPEKIQEVVTNLGCTLRLALEQIIIKSISWVSADGIRTALPFDPRVAALRSNGSVDCFVADTTAPILRRLQANTESGRVEIDYAITDPPASITSLDSTSFSEIVENSPSLQNLAASVGSSGLSAPAPAELASENGPATPSTASIISGLPTYGIALLSVFGSLIVVGIVYGGKRVLGGSHSRTIAQPQALVQEGRVVQVIYLSNPLEAKNSISNNRVDFLPRKVIGKRPVANP